ncbi:hypothetical protein P879_09188 [Paragonimus westermani]|uniref:Solute carrier family 5 (Sodium-coupled monocarboxylate transporter), member 8/12 n=1 Tax=Paragonimus westermani TaxID=34504 RepID=A0A8T0DEJ0_9TREM|nr:hypothetical protein P879_09188 [Paragonimus westermani]
MDFSLHWSDYAVFVFWLAIYSVIGIYHRFRGRIVLLLGRLFRTNQTQMNEEKENTETIFLGNRQLSLIPVFCSVMASFLSAVSLLGTTAEAYLSGMQFYMMIAAFSIAFPLASEVYMPVYYKLRLASAHEWVYISLALYAPSLAFSQVVGLPIWLSLISTGLVTTFYTALGGIRAVVWTDVFQLLILIAGMCVVVTFGIIKAGGPQRVWTIALENKRLQSFSFSPDPFLRHSVWSLAIGGASLVLCTFGANQTLVQRYLSCRNLQTARRAILLNIPTNVIFLLVQLTAGLVAFAYFEGCDLIKSGLIKKTDQILPYVVMVLFNGVPVVRGLFLSTIFAAALSTVSSGVNSLANVVLEDIIRPFHVILRQKDLSAKYMTIMAFVLSALIGLSTVGMAFLIPFMSSRILQFSYSLFGATGGPLLAVFTLGMIVPCVNNKVRFLMPGLTSSLI